MRSFRIEFGNEELVGEPVSRLPQQVRVTTASAEVEQPLPGLLRQISREHMVIGCHHPPDATGRLPSCGSPARTQPDNSDISGAISGYRIIMGR